MQYWHHRFKRLPALHCAPCAAKTVVLFIREDWKRRIQVQVGRVQIRTRFMVSHLDRETDTGLVHVVHISVATGLLNLLAALPRSGQQGLDCFNDVEGRPPHAPQRYPPDPDLVMSRWQGTPTAGSVPPNGG